MRQFDDPELAELFRDDPDLLDLTRAAHERDLDVPMAANFQAYLRARLMDEATHSLHPRGLARLRAALGTRSGTTAAFGGAAGAVMIAVAVFAVTQGGGNSGVRVPTAASPLNWNHSVDPRTNAITIAFTEPMDQASVVRALHIAPATSVSTSWTGNTLTISPTYGLSASTAYVVRIDNTVAHSSAGQAPSAPIVVAFGTQPTPAPVVPTTPSPTPAPPPAMATTVLGQTGPAADVLAAPDGRVLVTDVAAAAASTASSSSSTSGAATSPAASPATSVTSSATSANTDSSAGSAASATSAAAPSGLVSFGSGAPIAVGAAATAAAVSPTARYVAAVEPLAGGGADIVVENLDGTSPRHLAHADAGSPVAWTSGSSVLFVSGGNLRSVDLQGGTRAAGGPNGVVVADGRHLTLAPGGRWAYLGPSSAATASPSSSATPAASPSASAQSSPGASPSPAPAVEAGRLVDLTSGATLPLPGSGAVAAFAPDASAIGWVDGADPSLVDIQALGDQIPTAAAPVTVRPGTAGHGITALGLAPGGGGRVAATVDLGATSGPGAEVRVADSGGHVLATTPEKATHLAFTGDGVLAFVAGGHASTATIPKGPGTPTATPTPEPAVPVDAQALLDRLVAGQTGSPAALAALPVTGSLNLASLTPHGATQGYVIAVQAVPNSSQVIASVRLISIPRQGSTDPVTFSDETVTLDRPGATLVISKVTALPMTAEPSGPHVVHVAPARSAATMTVSVSFDADLDPSTVSQAIVLAGPAGLALPVRVTYDATSRTAVVTVPLTGQVTGLVQPLTLSVSTLLRDVDGNQLSQAFSTPLNG